MPLPKRTHRVCIVDEDEDVLKKLPPLLKQLGFETRCYTSVSDLLEVEEMYCVSFLLLEIHLREDKSLALLEDLKRKNLRIPTIAMISKSDINTAVNAMKLDVVDVLEKPIIYSLLAKQIRSIVRMCSQRHLSNPAL